MKIWFPDINDRSRERGATAIFVALSLAVFVMFAALAVDVGHLYGVKNELHNAADAGALAGAHELMDEDGNLTVEAAKAEASRVTPLNSTGKVAVDDFIVETGHWSFIAKKFTASENTTQAEWCQRSFSDLDNDPNFINAVRVQTRRPDTPSFFAGIFNIDQFFINARAVAYIGFAGSVPPLTVDQPIALCEQFLKVEDEDGYHYSCSVGRMISENDETGGWTNFTQPENVGGGCPAPTNPPSLKPLLCTPYNKEIFFGKEVSTNNGMDQSVFDAFLNDCWLLEDGTPPTKPLNVTLPVVDCLSGGFSQPCVEKVIGVVNVDIIWVQRDAADPAPREMYNNVNDTTWTCDAGFTDEQCWDSFKVEFELGDLELEKKSIYFLPNCDVHKPAGKSGGQNFGVPAEIPVLVQ